jgi:hypothetical protein
MSLLTHNVEHASITYMADRISIHRREGVKAFLYLLKQAWDRQHPEITLENGTRGWRRLRLACEDAKRLLSAREATSIDLVELAGGEVKLPALPLSVRGTYRVNCCSALPLGEEWLLPVMVAVTAARGCWSICRLDLISLLLRRVESCS